MNADDPVPPFAEPEWNAAARSALHDLYQAGHFEQVNAQAKRLLEQDPEDSVVHYYAALAMLALKRIHDAHPHVEFLVGHAPGEAFSHHAAGRYHTALGRWKDATRHVQTAISLDPDSAIYHTDAAIVALRQARFPEARAHMETALRLAPDDADVIRLYVQVKGLNETSAREAWQRIRHLEAALALDPSNAELHAGIGDIYLSELDQPREAEQCFRQALLLKPSQREHQKNLFAAVGQQRLLYRLLSIPARAFAWMENVGRGISLQPWRILWLLVGFKAVIVFLLWLVLATILFWPACAIYEWLLISDIRCASDVSDQHLRLKRLLNRWPFWVRFASFVVLIFGLWGGFFLVTGIPVGAGFLVLLGLAGVHFLVTSILFVSRKARSAHGRRAADKRPRPLVKPPPLPR